MNTGFINGFSVNGAAYPAWVIRAVVVAAAVASFTVTQTRTTFASAYGDAAVSVHLTQTHTIQARATTTASASVDVQPTLKYAGHSLASASATGNGAVRRDVFATAGGDATCTGEALTAQAIGFANAASAASVVLARAHIVFPGRAITPCVATGSAAGNVTRYPTVLAGWGEVLYRRAEASVKRSGTGHYAHDGYVLKAASTCTAQVLQSLTSTIATIGPYGASQAYSIVHSFIRYSARSVTTGINTAQPVAAVHIHRPRSIAQATASAQVIGTRMPQASVLANAIAVSYAPKARFTHLASGAGSANAVVNASALRTALGNVQALGNATASDIQYGMQQRADVLKTATASASARPIYRPWGRVSAQAIAFAFNANPGTQHRGDVSAATAAANVLTAYAQTLYRATALGSGVSLVGRAYGLANSEIKAPDDRYMVPSQEDRGMTVYAEERTMVVTA